MTTIVRRRVLPSAAAARVSLLIGGVSPLAWAVVASRLLIMAAGAFTTVAYKPVPGWTLFDPTRVTTSLGNVGNALTAAAVRWDSIHYLSIAIHGYKPAGDTRFFPLYPLLIHALSWVVGSDVAAGLLISFAAFAVALVLLHKLTSHELGDRAARATVLLLAFAPLSFFFTAIYTESLLLALSVGAFYLARRGRFVAACVVAAFAASTHGEGFLILAPLAYAFWERRGKPRNPRDMLSWEAVALLLPIAAIASVFVYDHAIGFGWLAPVTDSSPIGHARIMVVNPHSLRPQSGGTPGPVITIWHAVLDGTSGAWQVLRAGVSPIHPTLGGPFLIGAQNFIYLVVLVIALLSLVVCWRRLPRTYAIYATVLLGLFTSREGVPLEPLLSFDRYVLVAFPLWMSAAAYLEERRLTRFVIPLSTAMLIFYSAEFTRWVTIA